MLVLVPTVLQMSVQNLMGGDRDYFKAFHSLSLSNPYTQITDMPSTWTPRCLCPEVCQGCSVKTWRIRAASYCACIPLRLIALLLVSEWYFVPFGS